MRMRSPGSPITRLMKTSRASPSWRKATTSPRRGAPKRNANVLIKTYSPEWISGSIERPETCGRRMKKAAMRRESTASCNIRLATERHRKKRPTRPTSRRALENLGLRGRPEDQKRSSGKAGRRAAALPRCKTSAILREAPNMGVFGIVAIIAEHDVAVRRNSIRRAPRRLRRHVPRVWIDALPAGAVVDVDPVVSDLEIIRRLFRYVRLVQRRAIDVDRAVGDAQSIARTADHALDEVVGSRDGRRKNDHVPFARAMKAVFELVDEENVVNLQGRQHRAGRDVIRARDERDENPRGKPGYDERIEELPGDGGAAPGRAGDHGPKRKDHPRGRDDRDDYKELVRRHCGLFLQDLQPVERPDDREGAARKAGAELASPQRSGGEIAVRLRESPDVRIVGIVSIIAEEEIKAGGNAVGRLP